MVKVECCWVILSTLDAGKRLFVLTEPFLGLPAGLSSLGNDASLVSFVPR